MGNPGKNEIKKYIDDVDKIPKCAPFTNFTYCNLVAEGLLMAKKLYPKELERYTFDVAQYTIETLNELTKRKRMGVNVSHEIAEVKAYLTKNPALKKEISQRQQLVKKPFWRRVRSQIGILEHIG